MIPDYNEVVKRNTSNKIVVVNNASSNADSYEQTNMEQDKARLPRFTPFGVEDILKNRAFGKVSIACNNMSKQNFDSTKVKASLTQEKVNKSFSEGKEAERRKKARTTFTGRQIYLLERVFFCSKYLSRLERQSIASQLNVTSTQVKTWFQNRRTKWKKDRSKSNK
eukprot:gene8672-9610_t